MGAFSGVENAKMRGSSPEVPETGSSLAKGELVVILKLPRGSFRSETATWTQKWFKHPLELLS